MIKRKNLIKSLLISSIICTSLGTTAFADSNYNTNLSDYLSKTSSEPTGQLNNAYTRSSTIKTVTVTTNMKSLVGLTVAKHYATTWWQYDGSRLLSTRGVDNDHWTVPPNFNTGGSKGWDWYSVGTGGTGRSYSKKSYTFGVPTPWGPVGSNYSDTTRTTVKYNGSYSYY